MHSSFFMITNDQMQVYKEMKIHFLLETLGFAQMTPFHTTFVEITSMKYPTNVQKQPPEMSCKRRCSQKFAKFTVKHLCQNLFFNKVGSLRPATLLKKRLWHRCFPVNFAKFLRTPFLQNISGRLLLKLLESLLPTITCMTLADFYVTIFPLSIFHVNVTPWSQTVALWISTVIFF